MCWVFAVWLLCRDVVAELPGVDAVCPALVSGSRSELNNAVTRCVWAVYVALLLAWTATCSLQSRQTAVSDRCELTEDHAI